MGPPRRGVGAQAQRTAMEQALSRISSGRFWSAVDRLVATSRAVIDRPKGSAHPKIVEAVYPIDYGYLEGTTAGDGAGIDVWIGSIRPAVVTGVVCTIDSNKRDAEIKFLLGCTADEAVEIVTFLNKGSMAAVLISRPESAAPGPR